MLEALPNKRSHVFSKKLVMRHRRLSNVEQEKEQAPSDHSSLRQSQLSHNNQQHANPIL